MAALRTLALTLIKRGLLDERVSPLMRRSDACQCHPPPKRSSRLTEMMVSAMRTGMS